MALNSLSKTTKRNIVLAIVSLFVVLVIWLIPERKTGDQVSFLSITEKPNRLDFTTESGEFTIELEGSEWRVGEGRYPADHEKVKKILSFIEEERFGEIVSTANVYQPYGLGEGSDEQERLQITYSAGGQILQTIRVGKSANRIGTFYGMVGDDPTVYQIRFDRYDLYYQENDLLDLKIFNFSPPQIVKASFSDRNGSSWKLNRVEKQDESSTNQVSAEKIWEDVEGKIFPKEKVNDIINTLSTLIGQNIGDEPNLPSSNSNPLRVLSLTDNMGKVYEISILDKVEGGYWVSVLDKKYFYQISEFFGEKLLTDFTQ